MNSNAFTSLGGTGFSLFAEACTKHREKFGKFPDTVILHTYWRDQLQNATALLFEGHEVNIIYKDEPGELVVETEEDDPEEKLTKALTFLGDWRKEEIQLIALQLLPLYEKYPRMRATINAGASSRELITARVWNGPEYKTVEPIQVYAIKPLVQHIYWCFDESTLIPDDPIEGREKTMTQHSTEERLSSLENEVIELKRLLAERLSFEALREEVRNHQAYVSERLDTFEASVTVRLDVAEDNNAARFASLQSSQEELRAGQTELRTGQEALQAGQDQILAILTNKAKTND